MKQNKTFKEKVIDLKEEKRDLIEHIKKYVDAANFLSRKLVKDKEIVGSFNTETLILVLNSLNELEKIDNLLHKLEDEDLAATITGYYEKSKYTYSSIYNIEKDIYNKMIESEKILIKYNREFDYISQNADLTDQINELKASFKNELKEYRRKIQMLERTYSNHREDFEKEIHKHVDHGEKILALLDTHRRKHVDTKKLFISKFAYI